MGRKKTATARRKHLSRRQFERRVKLWGVVVPLLTAFIASGTSIALAVIPMLNDEPRVEPAPNVTVTYQIAPGDVQELDRIRASFDSVSADLNTVARLDSAWMEVDRRLSVLAGREAAIMRRYDPGFRE